jgi:hypothetical protein
MATAHLIVGRLGVGKTTLAKSLEHQHRAVRFSHDAWMSTLFGEDSPAEHFAQRHAQVSAVMTPIWTRCLTLGLDVVLDFGFWTRAERDDIRWRVNAAGAAHRLFDVICPAAAAWRRIVARNADLQGSLLITRPTFEALTGRFEPLESDEARETIENG